MAVYASRIVAWLADIAPQASCNALVHHGVVNALCSRLMDIEFIDVAEACIEALSKLSLHVPETCLKQVRAKLWFYKSPDSRTIQIEGSDLCVFRDV